MLIAVTGTPGVGKTSLSIKLADALNLKYIDFEGLLIEKGFYTSYDSIRKSYIIDIEKARKYFTEKSIYNAVLDGHNTILIYPCKKIDKIILLRCSPYILYERLKRKGYSNPKIIENVQAEILDIIARDVYSYCDRNKVFEKDVSEGIDKYIELIINFIKDRVKPDYGDKVDWLSLVMRNDDFKKFFP